MKNVNILIVENKNLVSAYIHKSLERDGFSVISVSDIQNIKNFTDKNKTSIIIIDEDFFDTYSKLSLKIPTLILSNNNNEDNIESKEYRILKPFACQDFSKKIKNIITQNNLNLNELSIDTLHIDTKNQIVKRGDKKITLTKKEYTLLVYLTKNKDEAVSRADLLENVWGMQIDPFSNTVEAHVFSLRKKIDGGQPIKLIHTIPKYGYRISVDK